MFYHSLPKNPSLPVTWWAVHAETLTPVKIKISKAPGLAAKIVFRQAGAQVNFQSHPEASITHGRIFTELVQEIRQHFHPEIKNQIGITILPEQAELPEYLLIHDAKGEHPGIFRTTDPHLIIPALPDDPTTLGQPSHWLAFTDLPATGWEYYWQDCQDAYESLTDDLITDH